MPIYFTDVAPTCPISTDSSTGPRQAHLFNRPVFIRPTIPQPRDFNSALIAANLLRNIIQSAVFAKSINNVVNNTYGKNKPGRVTAAQDKHKNKAARWTEQKDKRVRKKYKYYAKLANGDIDKSSYAIVERIERMVWYDKGWKSYLVWEYGDKGEGVPMP